MILEYPHFRTSPKIMISCTGIINPSAPPPARQDTRVSTWLRDCSCKQSTSLYHNTPGCESPLLRSRRLENPSPSSRGSQDWNTSEHHPNQGAVVNHIVLDIVQILGSLVPVYQPLVPTLLTTSSSSLHPAWECFLVSTSALWTHFLRWSSGSGHTYVAGHFKISRPPFKNSIGGWELWPVLVWMWWKKKPETYTFLPRPIFELRIYDIWRFPKSVMGVPLDHPF